MEVVNMFASRVQRRFRDEVRAILSRLLSSSWPAGIGGANDAGTVSGPAVSLSAQSLFDSAMSCVSAVCDEARTVSCYVSAMNETCSPSVDECYGVSAN